jgi:protein tyrosine/serine phosphatase
MKRRTRWALRISAVAVLIPALFVLARWGSGNFGIVIPGRVYRSAQPSASLAKAIREFGIKTVLNLRGSNPDQSWYRPEREATIASGATLVDFPMSSDQWLSVEQARALLDTLDSCEYPILVHCEWGAERTGLVSAICELIRDGSTIDDGRRAFSLYYLFLPMKDGLVMRGHLDRYTEWLSSTGRNHSPATFRRWLLNEYRPGSPSREQWECNPYPLKVVTRRGDSETTWGAVPCRTDLRR